MRKLIGAPARSGAPAAGVRFAYCALRARSRMKPGAPRLSLRAPILRTENVPVAWNRSVCHSTFRGDLQTIHLPEVNLPAVVAPENVALAISVVVADVLNVPIGRDESVHG